MRVADCDDALSAYNALVCEVIKIDADVAKDRQNQQQWILIFQFLFAIWLAIGGQAMLCKLLHFDFGVCDALFVISLIDLAVMLLLLIPLSLVSLELQKNKEKCRQQKGT